MKRVKLFIQNNTVEKFFTLTCIFIIVSRLLNVAVIVLFSNTKFLMHITEDKLHHYHIGIAIIVVSLILKNKLKPYFIFSFTAGLGLLIDEYAKLFSDIGIPLPYTHLSSIDNITILSGAFLVLFLLQMKPRKKATVKA